MLKLLRTSHLRLIRCRLSKTPATIQLDPSLSPLPPECRFSLHSTLLYHLTLIHDFPSLKYGGRNFTSRDAVHLQKRKKTFQRKLNVGLIMQVEVHLMRLIPMVTSSLLWSVLEPFCKEASHALRVSKGAY